MKLTLNRLKGVGREVERGWPGYMFGGHVRTSTVALIMAFLAVWWVYDTYRPPPKPPSQIPATQVVPPGFVPDPNYTWVPRSRVQQPPAPTTVTSTPTTTLPAPPPTTTQETTTTSPPPPFQLPGLPPLPPPFGPGTTPPTTEPPGPVPVPPGPGLVPGPLPGPAPAPGLPPG